MEARKIQKVGERSFSVSLPKKWILKNKLSSKDTIFIEEDENNKLIVSKRDDQIRQKKEITINIEQITNLSEFVVLCYVKNVDKIKFFWEKRNITKINKVKRILKFLDGYDIVQESEENMEIAFLFNDINITLPNTIRRMLHLLNLMRTALEEKDEQTMTDAEETIDRLHHLSRRILFDCLNNQKARNENKLSSEEEVIFYQDIVKKIEGIGDNIYNLKEREMSKSDIIIIKEAIDYLNSLLTHKKLEKKELTESVSKDLQVKNELHKINDRVLDIFQSLSAIAFSKKYF